MTSHESSVYKSTPPGVFSITTAKRGVMFLMVVMPTNDSIFHLQKGKWLKMFYFVCPDEYFSYTFHLFHNSVFSVLFSGVVIQLY